MMKDARLLNWAGKAGIYILLVILAGFVGGLFIIFQALQVSKIINAVFLGGSTLQQVMPWMQLLLGIILARAGFTLVGELAANASARRVKVSLRQLLVEKLMCLGPAYTHDCQSGELSALINEGVEALDAYFSQFLPQLILSAVVPLSVLVIVFPMDALTGLILTLTAPLIPIFMILIGKTTEAMTNHQWTTLSRMSGFFLDTLQGLTTLKQLNQSIFQAERISNVSERYRKATMAVLRITFLSAMVLELIGTLSTAVVAVEIGLRLLYGHIGFEGAFFILIITPEFYFPLRQLGLRFHASATGVAAAKKIFEVLDQPEPVDLSANSTKDCRTILMNDFTLHYEQVSYRYAGRAQDAVQEISFELHRGETLALVGASGSGKSTTAQFLLRFLTPQSGRILLNGQDINRLQLDCWRSAIAWVPQQPTLFSGSIADNIRLGKPGASEAEVRVAARQVRLDEWVESLPQQYETQVGEGGARLSGGQSQRVALARAFLKDAPLIVLDEPTAHLDPEQEVLVWEATLALCKGHTVVVIAHRLSTVELADQILVLENGRIVQKGSHTELAEKAGVYHRLLIAAHEEL